MAEPVEIVKKAVDAVEQVDLRVTDAIAEQRERTIVRWAGKLSEVGDQPPLRALTLGAAVVGLATGNPRLTRAGLRMFAAHSLATGAKTLVKRSVDRTRPDHAIDNDYRMEAGDSREHELSSFPSGHTAGALAVTQALVRDYPGTRWAGLAFTAAIAAVQVPRCKHFVSDILAGALIGWASEQVSSPAFDAAEEALARSGA